MHEPCKRRCRYGSTEEEGIESTQRQETLQQQQALYAGHDNLTSRDTITAFANAHQASLSVYEPGEHWFHTPDQLDAMTRWEKSEI